MEGIVEDGSPLPAGARGEGTPDRRAHSILHHSSRSGDRETSSRIETTIAVVDTRYHDDVERKSGSRGTEPLREAVDRTAIRRLLALTPAERIRLAIEEARNLQKFDQRRKSQ